MSSSDDERQSSKQGKATGDSAPKRTLMGMGPGQAAITSDDEFAAEATQIADDLADAVMEDIDSMFGEPANDEDDLDDFEGEKTEVGPGLRAEDRGQAQLPPKLPPIPRPRPKSSPPPPPRSGPSPGPPPRTRAEASANAPRRTLGGLPVGLDEESLPEPIRDPDEPRQRIPTQDGELPTINRHTGEQQAVAPSAPELGREPSSGDDALPAPIRSDENPWRAENRHDGITVLEDDEFHNEKTEMVDTPFESDPIVAKLVTLGGPENGTEYFASGLQNTVGRGINNSVVVPDLAMSRQHFEILRNADDSYTIRDLQSVNGTTLNGAKVREADLFHGDRIEAGKSLFQFVISGPAQPMQRQRRVVPAATATVDPENPPTLAPPPQQQSADTSSLQRLIIMVSIGAVLFSLTLIAVIALLRLQQGDETTDSAVTTQQESASSVYLAGVEAVRARDWDRAEAQFNKAKELDPSLDGIEQQLRRIGVEREATAALSAARSHLDENELDEARDMLNSIPRDSVYYAESRDLLRDTRKYEVEALYAQAQQALTDEDLQLSREKIAKILALVPTHQGATQLRERIDAIESGEVDVEEVVEEQAEIASNDRQRRPRKKASDNDDWGIELVDLDDKPKRKKRKRKTSKKSAGSRVPDLTRGFLLYRTRKFDQAQSFFEDAAAGGGPASSRAERTAKAIGEFETNYKAGNAAFKSSDWSTAEKKLIAAKRADSSVGGDYFDAELSTKLATAKAKLGLAELDNGDATKARSLYLQGRNFNAGDSTVKELGKQLEKEARSLYIKAVNKRKTDPAQAAKLCRNIMRIVPKSNETYGQASELLKSL